MVSFLAKLLYDTANGHRWVKKNVNFKVKMFTRNDLIPT